MFKEVTLWLFVWSIKGFYLNFRSLIKCSWAWYAIFISIYILYFFDFEIFGSRSGDHIDMIAGRRAHQYRLMIYLLVVASLYGAASSSIAVAWHRCLFLGEAPRSLHLKFGAREQAYLLKMLLIYFIVFAFTIGIVISARNLYAELALYAWLVEDRFVFWLLMGAAIVIQPIFLRLALIFPATACGDKLSIGTAVRDSSGLGFPMALAAIGLGLIVAGLSFALDYLISAACGDPVSVWSGDRCTIEAGFVLAPVLQIVGTALQVSVLTGGYYLMRERQANAAQQAQPPA